MNRASPDQGMPLSHQHRRQLLRLLLAFTAFFGAIFVVVNFFAERYWLMTIEAALVLLVLLMLPIVQGTYHLRRWCLFYLVSLYAATIYALASPTTSITVFSWVMVMPITAHLLLGRRWGGLFSAFYLAVAGGLFLWRFGTALVVSSPGATANVLAVTAWGYMFSHFYEARRESAERELSQQALTDPLTGLPNRAQLEQAFQRAAGEGALPLSLLMLDLDYFKRINDAHGHATGDAVLRRIAETLREQTRQQDVACRLGGEEFCVLLPRTDVSQARHLAERLRVVIEALRCHHNDAVLALTASIGVACATTPGEQLDPMLHTADKKLYEAKFGGRNRVVY
ncbi:GGDEF domain-containing protein [Salinisphaera orenii]|uniref:diguanylate cyclase n=1 Tax=Salinisphaera orenii YIM 95161 TaxID=1051139 RepID=A0A423PDI9_9GAMM|nr:GGDEF domain-containing protein [Salinisphaera halophila]ROO23085.1 diguanylate cyclase [Salinisphaera halophila YIM 95161]